METALYLPIERFIEKLGFEMEDADLDFLAGKSGAPIARESNWRWNIRARGRESGFMAAVDIRGVRKAFGPVAVIHGVDVSIGDEEFVVLVGPSGCGKSTLLRMIAGLEQITSGEIAIGGRVVNNLPPKERDIAMVFQNYALYPHMTVRDNMAFSLKLRKADQATVDQRVNEAAEILGLVPFLDRYPRQLSGGQRQRVAMGRAIVRDPQVFLFDEPLSNLDAKLRVQMRTEIKSLHQRLRTTSIYVTHDQVEAMTMADRIVVMHDGRVEQIGTPLELYDRPDNLFVAGFIGSPAMNFIKGRLRLDGGIWVEAADGTRLPAPPNSRGRDRHAHPAQERGPGHAPRADGTGGRAGRPGRRHAAPGGGAGRAPGLRRAADGQGAGEGTSRRRWGRMMQVGPTPQEIGDLVIPIFGMLTGIAITGMVVLGPVGRAVGRVIMRIFGADREQLPAGDLQDIRALLEDQSGRVEAVQRQLGELAERQDFAERLLAQGRKEPRLPGAGGATG